jgi:NCS1 family nucleobase:cation symporter-1
MDAALSVEPQTATPTPDRSLYNDDLAPVPPERRTWGTGHIASLWIGMAIQIPTYTLAGTLVERGMDWKQAIFTVLLGNMIILIPLILNGFPGTAYGIPFPVLIRSSFGTRGANIPALMRAFVACGWFGVQTWIGGEAIYQAILAIWTVPAATVHIIPALGINGLELVCFLIFWAINMAIIVVGMDCIKWFEILSAPVLILTGIGLLTWGYMAAKGWGPMLDTPTKLDTPAKFWPVFIPALTAMVGFWSTLSLNIPDFSRFARNQKAQIWGQALGLPLTMAFYSFVGIAVTSVTIVVFGHAIWDPVQLMGQFHRPALVVFALFSMMIATLSTNIAANVVSPANDFSNLWPSRISFRLGGLITGAIGLCIFPWKLLANADYYINGWLLGYSGFTGPIAGIMIADYFVYRKQRLNVPDLYSREGEYTFIKGFSLIGIGSLILGCLPTLPGFLVAIRVIAKENVPGYLISFYSYSWFGGLAIAMVSYVALRRIASLSDKTARSNLRS